MWIKCKDQLPPNEVVVETKIDDEKGCRNIAELQICNNLWWVEDMLMYVYYSPTHWRYLE